MFSYFNDLFDYATKVTNMLSNYKQLCNKNDTFILV
nr:MAG TPA: hypothetical protein [Bacteriophage sp.]